uniref:Uncharacterized protein n=1 Tax=Arundo donax TaxID=35708 RepID=A0A0A9CLS0_ARUDO
MTSAACSRPGSASVACPPTRRRRRRSRSPADPAAPGTSAPAAPPLARPPPSCA